MEAVEAAGFSGNVGIKFWSPEAVELTGANCSGVNNGELGGK